MALGTGEELAVYDHSIAPGQEAFIYEDDGSLAASAGDANRSLNSASGTETWRMRGEPPAVYGGPHPSGLGGEFRGGDVTLTAAASMVEGSARSRPLRGRHGCRRPDRRPVRQTLHSDAVSPTLPQRIRSFLKATHPARPPAFGRPAAWCGGGAGRKRAIHCFGLRWPRRARTASAPRTSIATHPVTSAIMMKVGMSTTFVVPETPRNSTAGAASQNRPWRVISPTPSVRRNRREPRGAASQGVENTIQHFRSVLP